MFLKVLDFDFGFYMGSPIALTPGRAITTLHVSGTAMAIAMNVYYHQKYAKREAKLGIKWQWKRDATACALCQTKFPTTAMRKEESKVQILKRISLMNLIFDVIGIIIRPMSP